MKKRYVTIPRNPDDSVVLAAGVDFRSRSQRTVKIMLCTQPTPEQEPVKVWNFNDPNQPMAGVQWGVWKL